LHVRILHPKISGIPDAKVRHARAGCNHSLTPWQTTSRYNISQPLGPLRHVTWQELGQTSTMAGLRRYVLPIRDPWTRICSAFRSKVIGDCHSDERCIRRKWVQIAPADGILRGRSLFDRFLEAVATAGEGRLNDHFAPQSERCLAEQDLSQFDTSQLLPVDIDSNGSMQSISSALGRTGASSFDSVMAGRRAYSHRHVSTASVGTKYCYTVRRSTIMRVAKFLSPDYRAMHMYLKIKFNSERVLRAASSGGARALMGNGSEYHVCMENYSLLLGPA